MLTTFFLMVMSVQRFEATGRWRMAMANAIKGGERVPWRTGGGGGGVTTLRQVSR